jgi:dipeptidyl aminopeptidase/acylaminoacyl peptidase
LTRITNSPGWDLDPAWSPDGQRLVFESDRDSTDRGSKSEIYVANADGSGQTRLTGGDAYNAEPTFSPDGTKIAFTRETFDEENPQYDVFTMNADGTNLRRLTNTSSNEYSPDFSPDGTKIIYNSGKAFTTREIYTINADDGSHLVNVSNHAADDFFASFSPDGRKIVFESDRDGNYELYVANADGTGPTRITNNPGPDSWPNWQPSSNEPPTADAGGPYTVDEGGSIALAATGSDPEGGTLAYAWDLDGDGAFETSGQNATFSAANLDGPDSRTVAVRVTDAEGESATDGSTISVTNVAPAAAFSAPASVDEGNAINLSLNDPSDAAAADENAGFSYAFDCGAGYGSFGPDNQANCQTNDNGPRAVKARVRDKDGGVSEYTGSVDVRNVAPTVTGISAPSRVLKGKSVSFEATATDPSSADTNAGFSWLWSVTVAPSRPVLTPSPPPSRPAAIIR